MPAPPPPGIMEKLAFGNTDFSLEEPLLIITCHFLGEWDICLPPTYRGLRII